MTHVTVDEITPRTSYSVGGTPQDTFTIPSTWGFFALTDFRVWVDGTEISYNASPADATEFSVSGTAADGGYQGGTITLGATVTNATVVVERDVPSERTEDFPYPSSTLNILTLNTALDKIAAWAQQLKAKFSRALMQPASDTDDIGELPAKATRASKFLGFDANGDPIASPGTDSSVPISSFGATLVDDADAAAARTTLGLGTAAVENVAAGGSGDLLRADGDGSSLTGIATGATDAEKANIALNAFRIAVNGSLTVQNMVDGVSDEFEDETGVDTAASTNETYDATGDYYTNPGTVTTPSASGEWSGNTAAFTFTGDDIDPSGSGDAAIYTNDTLSGDFTVQFTKDGNGGIAGVYLASSQASFDQNAPSGDIGVTEWWSTKWDKGNAAYDFVNQATFTAPSIGDVIKIERVGSTLKLYVNDVLKHTWTQTSSADMKIAVSTGNANAFANDFSWTVPGTPPDMTLLSNATTANATPTEAFIAVWQEDVDSVTLNTDLKAYVSRDGGTTWTQITLADEATLSTGRILTGSADISAQPSGTSMKWKIETLNAKEQRIHAVSLEWS